MHGMITHKKEKLSLDSKIFIDIKYIRVNSSSEVQNRDACKFSNQNLQYRTLFIYLSIYLYILQFTSYKPKQTKDASRIQQDGKHNKGYNKKKT